MAPDVLRLRNMHFFAHHGVLPEENRLGQRFDVDVELFGDFSVAGETDEPSKALDYPEIYAMVQQVVVRQRFKLVEALAEHVAEAIGRAFAPIELTVRVRKPNPPVEASFDGIEVELHRSYG